MAKSLWKFCHLDYNLDYHKAIKERYEEFDYQVEVQEVGKISFPALGVEVIGIQTVPVKNGKCLHPELLLALKSKYTCEVFLYPERIEEK